MRAQTKATCYVSECSPAAQSALDGTVADLRSGIELIQPLYMRRLSMFRALEAACN